MHVKNIQQSDAAAQELPASPQVSLVVDETYVVRIVVMVITVDIEFISDDEDETVVADDAGFEMEDVKDALVDEYVVCVVVEVCNGVGCDEEAGFDNVDDAACELELVMDELVNELVVCIVAGFCIDVSLLVGDVAGLLVVDVAGVPI